jgi:hypothetical protein
MSPVEETLTLLDLTGTACVISRKPGSAIITPVRGMQVLLCELDDGLVEVIYEQPLGDAREECEPARAAAIVGLILSRKQLEQVTLPRG